MKHAGLSDPEVIAEWQHRVRIYKQRRRVAWRLAAGLLALMAALFGAAHFLPGRQADLAQLIALLLGFAGLAPLQLYAISSSGLLHCPRCGFAPQGIGWPGKGGRAGAVVCEHCLAQLDGPAQPDSLFNRVARDWNKNRT